VKAGGRGLACLALIGVSIAAVALLYPTMPPTVPIHWNARGEIDGFAPKAAGAFFLPVIMVVTHLIFLLITRVAGGGQDAGKFRPAMETMELAAQGFLLWTGAAVFMAAFRINVPMPKWIFCGVGALLAVLGSSLPGIRRNGLVGIRTPWTLQSDEVWRKTHELARLTMLAGGTVVFLAALGGMGFGLLMVLVLASVLIPAVWSYIFSQKITDKAGN